jgi:HSP20 family molecular chaperone IbpA
MTLDNTERIYYAFCMLTLSQEVKNDHHYRWDPFRNLGALQDQMNRLFAETFRGRGDESALTIWAPPVDIYETENEFVLKADLPDLNEKDLDIR